MTAQFGAGVLRLCGGGPATFLSYEVWVGDRSVRRGCVAVVRRWSSDVFVVRSVGGSPLSAALRQGQERRVRPESGNDAVFHERGERVHRVAATGANLEVQMGAGDIAGGADGADHISAVDAISDADVHGGLVTEPDLSAVIEGDHGLVSVRAVVASGRDGSVGDGSDRVAGVAVEVEAGVIAGPETVLAEGRGDRVAVQRQHPLVLFDLRGLLLRGSAEPVEFGLPLSGLLLGQGDQLCVCFGGGCVAGRVAADDFLTSGQGSLSGCAD